MALWDRRPPEPSWPALLSEIDPSEGKSLLIGAGCGFTRIAVDDEVLEFLSTRPVEEQPELFYGLARCLYPPNRTQPVERAFSQAGLERLSELARAHFEQGRRDALVGPPTPAARSTVACPAERMRALPPLGPRPEPVDASSP